MAGESSPKTLKSVGGFELIQKIGQGGMGSVFKARQVSLDREVAVKILPPSIAQKDAVFIERFIREARTSAKLNHSNIVQGIEVGKDAATGLYYFAMEYVDGPTVKQLLAERKYIDEKRALRIVKGVTEALICAHRAGIVHRDIKPDNIILTSNGDPKLADLGLARFVMDDSLDEQGPRDGTGRAGGAELTQTGQAVGTPAYMAPEQIRGQNDDLDARTDLYELGATWFHIATGRPPYQADGVNRILAMHLTAPVPNAHAVNPAVSEAASRIIGKLMHKDKAGRIQSAEALLAQIDKLQQAHNSGVKTTGRRTPIGSQNRAIERRATEKQAAVEQGVVKKKLPWRYIAIGAAPLVIILIVILSSLSGGETTPELSSNGGKTEAAPDPKAAPAVKTEVSGVTKSSPAATPESHPDNSRPMGLLRPNSTEAVPDWPALKKAMEYARQKPSAYQTAIRMFAEAERGAPPSVVPAIRHEQRKAEQAQRRDFKALFGERSTQALARAGARDYASALKLMALGSFPAELLGEFPLQEIRRVRGEIEAGALDDYTRLIEPELQASLREAGKDTPKLQALREKLDKQAAVYETRSTVEELEILRRRVDVNLLAAKAETLREQGRQFRKVFEQAQALAAGGDFEQAIGALEALAGDAELKARYGPSAAQIVRDIQAARQLLLDASAALVARAGRPEDVSLHPSGVSLSGRITARKGEGPKLVLTIETKSGFARDIEVAKLDAADLAAACALGSSAAPDTRYRAAMYNFWQGRQKQAYEALQSFTKESGAEADRANFYIGWMNDSAEAIIAQVRGLYWEVNWNSKLDPEAKKKRKEEAQALARKLKNDLYFTEAYNDARNAQK